MNTLRSIEIAQSNIEGETMINVQYYLNIEIANQKIVLSFKTNTQLQFDSQSNTSLFWEKNMKPNRPTTDFVLFFQIDLFKFRLTKV